MKKFLTVLLALLMVLSALPMAFAEEDVPTLTYFANSGHTASEHTDLIKEKIEEVIGGNFEMIIASDIAQQLALYVADGDIPDLVWLSYDLWYEYAQEGLWADLTPYMEQCPTLFNEYVEDESIWTHMGVDGEGIYGIPSVTNIDNNNCIYVRQDWLDNLGLAQPTTVEEFIDVMYAFTNDDPDGDGQADTYGLGINTYEFLSPIAGAYGAVISDQQYFLNEDGTVTTNAISADYRTAVAKLAELWADGVIHPEALNNLGFGFSNNWALGEAGIWSTAWSHGAMSIVKAQFAELSPEGKQEILPANPVGPDGKSGNYFAGAFTTVVGVSDFASDEEKEMAMKLLEWQATDDGFWTVFLGLEGEYFEYDENGDIAWSWNTHGGKTKSGKDVVTVEMYKMLYHELMQGELYAKAYEATGLEKDRLLSIGSSTRVQQTVYDNLFKYLKVAETAEYGAELKNYFEQSLYGFIKGEKDINDDAVWQEYVDTYLSMGGEEIRTALLERYNSVNGTAYTFA